MVSTNQTETTLQTLHTKYVETIQQNHPHADIFSLEEIMGDISKNSQPTDDIETLTKSVLEAMIYTCSNIAKEKIERAESDFATRFEEMTPEQQKVCMQYRLKIG